MKYSSRFFLYAPFGLFLAIALGVGIHWWLAASALSTRLAAMNGREIVPGVTMRFASRSIAGFPFSLDTVFHGVLLRSDTPRGPTEWRPEQFAMHALTYGREETIFEAAGKQELSWTRDDGSKRRLVFAVGSLRASAIEDREGLARFDFDLVGLDSTALTARRLQFHIRRDGDDKVDLAALADDIRISAGHCPGLGDRLATGRLMGTVTQARSFSSLRAGAQDWGSAVANWRAAGGMLRIDALWLAPSGGKQTADQARSASRLRAALAQTPADRLFTVTDLLSAFCDAGH
ncbi:MAG: DUF2125 domain-containing protein [Rhizomicrobium sp.]|jgi:hypothetical protein